MKNNIYSQEDKHRLGLDLYTLDYIHFLERKGEIEFRKAQVIFHKQPKNRTKKKKESISFENLHYLKNVAGTIKSNGSFDFFKKQFSVEIARITNNKNNISHLSEKQLLMFFNFSLNADRRHFSK